MSFETFKDPRFKNETFASESLSDYARQYAQRLNEVLSKVDFRELESAYALVKETAQNERQIFVAGNGGSCAIADHLCCDWVKGTHVAAKPAVRVQSLTANSALYTALVNDIGPAQAFSAQLGMLARPGDLVLLISSSGNSPNIVEAARVAKERGLSVIGFTGFSGGRLRELADVCVHVPAGNYGISEDAHQVLMHAMSQFLAREREQA